MAELTGPPCAECATPHEPDFRYCLVCGGPRVAIAHPATTPPTSTATVGDTQVLERATTTVLAAPAATVPTGLTALLDNPTPPGASQPRSRTHGNPVGSPASPKRHRKGWLVAALVLLLAGAGIGAWLGDQSAQRSSQVAAVLSQDRRVINDVLARLAAAGTTSDIRSAAAAATAQQDQNASATELADAGQGARITSLGRALASLSGLTNLTPDRLSTWEEQRPTILAALLAAPDLTGMRSTAEQALDNISQVVSRGQAALADWEQRVSEANSTATATVASVDAYSDDVRSYLEAIRRLQSERGSDLKAATADGSYSHAASTAKGVADDFNSQTRAFAEMTQLPAMAWQHEELARAVGALAIDASTLADGLDSAATCQFQGVAPTTSATASPAPESPTPTSSDGFEVSASPSPTESGPSPTDEPVAADCDQLARDAWAGYLTAAASTGPELDSAVATWEARVAEIRQEAANQNPPARPTV